MFTHMSYVPSYAPAFPPPAIGLFTAAADLPRLVHAHAKRMALVVPVASAAGARLRPVFEPFATNRAYAGVTFGWLSAADAARRVLRWRPPSF
jgi:hypothetical protein